jgi:hypothetical protein
MLAAAGIVLVLLAGGALGLGPGLGHSASTESAAVMLPSSAAGGSADAGGGSALSVCLSSNRAEPPGVTLLLAHPFGRGACQGSAHGSGGVEVTAANGSRGGPLPALMGTPSPPLRDAPWLHRFAAFVN